MNRTPTPRIKPLRLAIAALSAGALPFTAQAIEAGKVYFATGNASLVRDGRPLPLRRGAAVESGDTIETGNGRAQIRFRDGHFVSLQPDTTFKVDRFEYEEQKQEGKGFFSLVKGGLRAISGLIGRKDREAYRLKTPVATIGIRGTEYLVKLNGGLYVNVGDGSIWIKNEAGELVLLAGQSAVVPGEGQPPQQTDNKPVLPPEQGGGGGEEEGFSSPENVTGEGKPDIIPQGLTSGSRYALANVWADTCCFEGTFAGGSPSQPVNATFSGGALVAWTGPSPVTVGAIGNATATDFGSDAGTIGWGRWTGGTLSVVNGIADTLDDDMHYVIGIPTATMPTSGTASYSLVGATSPTRVGDGLTGTVNSGSMNVAFGAMPSISTTLNLSLGGNSYTLNDSFSGPGDHTFSGFGLNVSDTMGNCASASCNASLEGFFAGQNASHAGYSYEIYDGFNNSRIMGAAAFSQGGGGGRGNPP
ncbi:MAG: hypothetical protein D6786_05285 [Gammaproteobacteria bacterium]|nr:MAG: hypothetical protein D6786_05285 [Gammaproteobacteria bacterium]